MVSIVSKTPTLVGDYGSAVYLPSEPNLSAFPTRRPPGRCERRYWLADQTYQEIPSVHNFEDSLLCYLLADVHPANRVEDCVEVTLTCDVYPLHVRFHGRNETVREFIERQGD